MSEQYLLIWREYPNGLLSTLAEDTKPFSSELEKFSGRYTQIINNGDQLIRHLAQDSKIEPVLITHRLAKDVLGWDI
jgi:hypothetical protein